MRESSNRSIGGIDEYESQIFESTRWMLAFSRKAKGMRGRSACDVSDAIANHAPTHAFGVAAKRPRW
jgi:hypothetical protein